MSTLDNYDIRTVAALSDLMKSGNSPGFIFFWGHTAQPDAPVGKQCFSQWWPVHFELDGKAYPTVEHFMMAEKARLFGDEEIRTKILAASSPGAAKRLGREVRGFDEGKWEEARFDIVVRGNIAKFGQNAELREFLLQTGESILVEASPVDRIWGIGLAADDPRAEHPDQWDGLNLLGFALMEARAFLRKNPAG